jgi:hypothetical protein
MRASRLAPAVLVLAIAGCGTATTPSSPTAAPPSSTGSTPAVSHTKGLPPSVTVTGVPGQPLVGWLGPGRMYLVTYGSGSCPKLPTGVTAASGNRLTITTASASDGPCTMDFGPTTSVIDVPQGIDDTQSVQVTVDGTPITVQPR